MDKKLLGAKLKALRESLYPRPVDFTRKTGIKHTQIVTTEAGSSYLRTDLLDNWLRACGTTLAQFFAELEGAEAKPKKNHLKEHKMLQDLLDHGGDPAAWITGNLEAFHRAYVRGRRRRD